MIENYKMFENLQQAKKTLKELKVDEKDPRFVELRELLKKNLGYMGTFTKWIFKDHESFDRVKDVFEKLTSINNLDRKVDEFEKLEDLYDYLQIFESNRSVNQIIKSLPSRTRQYVSEELRELLRMKSGDKINKAIKNLYSKKGGKYHDSASLLQITKEVIENVEGGWDMETIKAKLEAQGIMIVKETDHILMARIDNYTDSKAVGSKHWCIVTSESMWNSYVTDFTTQYFAWNFDKEQSDREHMFGCTISPSGVIANGHWADDAAIGDTSVLDNA